MAAGAAQYEKRLSSWTKLSIIELPEHRLSQTPSPAEISLTLEKEGNLILSKIPPKANVIALCIEGKLLDSIQLSEYLSAAAQRGVGHHCFIIGGSFGLSDKVKQAAHLRLSMSPMTFPHQLARVLLLEQIYRGFSIMNNSKYHK